MKSKITNITKHYQLDSYNSLYVAFARLSVLFRRSVDSKHDWNILVTTAQILYATSESLTTVSCSVIADCTLTRSLTFSRLWMSEYMTSAGDFRMLSTAAKMISESSSCVIFSPFFSSIIKTASNGFAYSYLAWSPSEAAAIISFLFFDIIRKIKWTLRESNSYLRHAKPPCWPLSLKAQTGRDERTRTSGLRVPNAARCQLRYIPILNFL